MKRKNKNIVSITDSDINQDLLDKSILKNEDLEILKFLGEIYIDLEDSYEIKNEDNSFSAHNEMGNLRNYGGEQPYVENLKILWYPSLEDVKDAINEGLDNSKSSSGIKKSESLKKMISSNKGIDLTELIKPQKIAELEEYIIENLYDAD